MNKLFCFFINRSLVTKIICALLILFNNINLYGQETKCMINFNAHTLRNFKKENNNYYYIFEKTSYPGESVIVRLDSSAQVMSSKVTINGGPRTHDIIEIDSSNYLLSGFGYLIKMNQNYSTIWRKRFIYRKNNSNLILSNNKMYRHDSIIYLLSSFNSGNVISAIDLEGNVKWSYDLNAPKNNLLASQLMSNGDIVVVLSFFQSNKRNLNIIRFTKSGAIKYSKLIIPPYPYQDFIYAATSERKDNKVLIASHVFSYSYLYDGFKLAFHELDADGEVTQSFTTQDHAMNHFIREDTNTIVVFTNGAQLLFYQIPDTISDLFLIESSNPPINFIYNQTSFQETTKSYDENIWISGRARCGSKLYFALDIRKPNFEGACHTESLGLEFQDENIDYEITNFISYDSISLITSTAPSIGFHNYVFPEFHDLCLGCDTLNISSLKENNELHIFPNPSKDVLQIQFSPASKNPIQIQIFDLSGRLVQSENLNRGLELYQISVAHLQVGSYLLQITDGEKRTRQVFIKN